MKKFNIRKCGEMYVKFDKLGNPEYGFMLDAFHNIDRIVNMSDKEITEVIIPNTRKEYEDDIDKEYVRVKTGCFAGYDNINVVIPSKTSPVLFYDEAFDAGAHINMVIPNNNSLFIETEIRELIYYDSFSYHLVALNPSLKKNQNKESLLTPLKESTTKNNLYANLTTENLDEYMERNYNIKPKKAIIKNKLNKEKELESTF